MTTVYELPGELANHAPRKSGGLRALMDFYESTENVEEDEIELMIQLSGMVGSVQPATEYE